MSSGVSGLKSRNCIPKGVLWAGGDMARDEFYLHYMATPLQKNDKDTKNKFAKFLIMKHEDEHQKLTKLNPFVIEKALREILGKKTFYEMKPLSSGLLLIEVDQKQTHDKLLQVRKLRDIPVIVEPHATLNKSKGTIYCDVINSMSDEQILEELKDQEVTEVHRIKKRQGDTLVPTGLFVITFGTTILPKVVKVGYMFCQVRLYIPNPRRCFKCQGYGHGHTSCTHEQVCAKCAHIGSEHPSFADCEGDTLCYHCHSKDHPTSSKECPMYILESLIMEQKVKNNQTYTVARDKIYAEKPQLVSQIKTIKKKKSTPTYSTAAASASTTDQLMQQQQQFFAHQQQLLVQYQQQMQQQINMIVNVLKSQQSSTSNEVENMDDSSRKVNIKRSRVSISSEEEDDKPSKRVTSGGQEVLNRPAPPVPPPVAVETPAASGKTTAEGTDGEGWRTVGKGGIPKPALKTSLSSAASKAAVPPAPPTKGNTESVKAGSSDPSKDKRSAVSKKPIRTNITAPKSWKN